MQKKVEKYCNFLIDMFKEKLCKKVLLPFN